ncbi:MAG: hypothetical protein JNM77_01335 [Pseudonocardia sp.]|nr:hypothetical protein [Pseudonocardia sp.]
MDGFEVPVEALRDAGRAAGAAAADLAGLPLAQAVGAVEEALPGGAAGAAAVALAAAWRARLAAAAAALDQQAGALRAAADGYDRAEHGVVAALVVQR